MKHFLPFIIGAFISPVICAQNVLYLDDFNDSTSKELASTMWMVTPDKEHENLVIEYTFTLDSVLISKVHKQDNEESLYEGEALYYYPNGRVKMQKHFHDGKLHGDVKTFYENSRPKRIAQYEDGEEISCVIYDEDGNEIDYFPLLEKPSFIGGEQALFQYLGSETKYPQAARDSNIQGIVYVAFLVAPNGDIGEIRIKRGVHPILDQEAIRVVNGIQKFNPGKEDGVVTEMVSYLLFRFTLR